MDRTRSFEAIPFVETVASIRNEIGCMPDITDIAGWVPAIVFPVATAAQAYRIAMRRSADGISVSSWFFFGLANLGLYVYTEKYQSIQSIVGFLVTAVIDFVIVGQCIFYRRKRFTSAGATPHA